MLARVIIIVGWCLLGCGLFSPAQAKIKSFRELTPQEMQTLAESQRRLVIFDHMLQTTESSYAHRKISRGDYAYQKHELVAFISAEAKFQNDILIHNREFISEEAREILENIARYAILVPAYALAIVAKGLASSGGSYSFSP